MPFEIRSIEDSDEESVRKVSESNWDRDYVPDRFLSYQDNPLWHMFGLFEDGVLLGFAALQEVDGADFGWAKALRVRSDRHREGIGLKLTNHCIELAKDRGLNSLRYATSSRNEASIGVAKQAGFDLMEEVGYFRLEDPYPQQPNPSPIITPIMATPERVAEAMQQNPDLVPTTNMPASWEFERKTLDGIKRIAKEANFNIITNEKGLPISLYYFSDSSRNNQITRAHTLYCTDRSIFVDVMARLVDDLKSSEVDRAAFFLGPRATEWSDSLLAVSEKYQGRRFLLYERSF
jgi:GNAT superfamily N-acetyltransferase